MIILLDTQPSDHLVENLISYKSNTKIIIFLTFLSVVILAIIFTTRWRDSIVYLVVLLHYLIYESANTRIVFINMSVILTR